MLYDESTASSLRPWLVRTLQPICDADPEALADYVLALLKHDAAEPELRKMFVSQLEEFLEKEASNFVDSLFSALRTRSYLPYEPVKSDASDPGIPIPLDALIPPGAPSDRGRKRSLEGGDRQHPPPKGPRLGNDAHFSRYSPSNGRMHGQSRGMGDHRGGGERLAGGRGEDQTMNGLAHGMDGLYSPPMYRPPSGFVGRGRRGICRDYHSNGFCARGSLCQYSHGDDAVIPPMPYTNAPGMMNSMPNGGASFIPMFGNGVQFGGIPGAAYDPHESHMEMGPRQGRGPRIPESHSMHDAMPISSVELPVIQDLTPRDSVEEASRSDGTLQPNGFTHNFGTPRRAPLIGMGMMPGGVAPVGFGGRGGAYRRPGRGTFSGDNHTFNNGSRDDKTLVVEKIPEDRLTLEAVNEWFKRFGTVTNVAIDGPNAKALVSFSNNAEARAAWKCEEAVFGNRFVKVFWHRPLEGQGSIGQKALAASAPLIRNVVAQESTSQLQPPSQPSASPQPSTKPSTTLTPPKQQQFQKPDSATVAALAARQQHLEKQISEQKVLMSRLTTASTPEEKQEIMARIRAIQSDTSSTPILPSSSTSKMSNGASQGLMSEKERLDKELEMHTAQGALTGSSGGGDPETTTTAALQEKLARLKAEASRLGLPDSEINADSSQPVSTPYRPYRGRGYRGRGYVRGGLGRGGPSRGSMKLDNRPRRLLVSDIPVNDEAVQLVRNHYQNMGNLETFWSQGDGEVVAQFWSRSAAEHALANPPDIPSVGKVKVKWHTGMAPSSTPTVTPAASGPGLESSDSKTGGDQDMKLDTGTTQGEHDDGGWGQAYDDDDDERRRRSRSRSFS